MLWPTLRKKLDRLNRKAARKHVHAVILNPLTGKYESFRVALKYDADGVPYFIRAQEPEDTTRTDA